MNLPELEELKRLEPEEIGFLLLQWIEENPRQFHRNSRSSRPDSNLMMQYGNLLHMYPTNKIPRDDKESIEQLIMEGWQWLEHAGLIAINTSQQDPVFKTMTRRGKSIQTEGDFFDFRASRLLPDDIIHPKILLSSKSHFLRKDFESAIFSAFRQIEIEVRSAGEFAATDVGVVLMRKAFHSNTGPLTDHTTVEGEKEAMQHLFAGAIGMFKNPSSHRGVEFTADEAIELIFTASRLLKIVDSRLQNMEE